MTFDFLTISKTEKNNQIMNETASENTTKMKTMRLKESVIVKVEELAKSENRNFTNMVETILMERVSQ